MAWDKITLSFRNVVICSHCSAPCSLQDSCISFFIPLKKKKRYQKASVTASVEMTHYKMASHNAHTSHHFVRKTQTKVGTPTSQHLVKYNYHKLRLCNIYDIKFLQPPMHETGMCTNYIPRFLLLPERNVTSSAWKSLKIIPACAHFKSAFISKAVGFPRTFLSGFGIKQENAFIEPWRIRLIT